MSVETFGCLAVIGCCPACERCMGSQINCHQEPCRCELPCSCNFATDEPDLACKRHDSTADQRHPEVEPEPDEDGLYECIRCGEWAAEFSDAFCDACGVEMTDEERDG